MAVIVESELRAGPEAGLPAEHPLLGAVELACGQVQAAADTAIWSLCDADLDAAIGGCERLRAQTHSVELALIAEADGRALGTRSGAASTTAWLRHRFRVRPGHAKSLVHTANAVGNPDDEVLDYAATVSRRTGRELVATGKALAEGAVSPEHAAIVDKIMSKVPRAVDVEGAVQAEQDLAGFCREFDPGTVARLGDYMLEMMRTDTLDDEDEHRHHHRTLRLDEQTGGISGQLTRDGIALLRSALDPLAAPNPGAGGEPDLRTAGQRLADALVELARRALASDGFAANHGISHRVMVAIGLDSLTGAGGTAHETASSSPGPPTNDETGSAADKTGAADVAGSSSTSEVSRSKAGKPDGITGGTSVPAGSWFDRPLPRWAVGNNSGLAPAQLEWGSHISPSTALRMACHASVQRVLLDPAGAVLDVGRERRTVTPSQYAALIARDGGCAFPGCTRPPAWCIAHHIKHWANGGNTDLDNLVMLCSHHHRVIHHDGWLVHVDCDRLPTFTPPRWIDPDRHPRRNNRPRARYCGRGASGDRQPPDP